MMNAIMQLRCYWYLIMTALDETAQKTGLCGVQYFPGSAFAGGKFSALFLTEFGTGFHSKAYSMAHESSPIRCTHAHIAYDDPRMEVVDC
jgi:hypothetical protein